MDRLAGKLTSSAPRLRVVATLRKFPQGLKGFELVQTVRAEMSWTLVHGRGECVHLYSRCAAAMEEG